MKLIILLILLAGLSVSHLFVYQQGRNAERLATVDATDETKETEREQIAEVVPKQIKREVVYRERIKYIYKAVDPTGCLDTTLGAAGLFDNTTQAGASEAGRVPSDTSTEN